MMYDNEMVEVWMNKFKESNENKKDAIEEAKGTIENEKIWMNGSDTQEQVQMHVQNILNLEEYIKRLNELKGEQE